MHDRMLVCVTSGPIPEDELRAFVTAPASGGVVVFSGVVRNHHEGRRVLRIEYSAAAGLAQSLLGEIAGEALRDPAVHRVAAVHRTGTLEIGEASVVVAASAAHRERAFRAARLLIDRIKEVLPVWKREHFADGTAEWAEGFAVRVPVPAGAGRARGAPGC